ncbi:MAG TPA: RluA family pseudouridine synthase [Natronincola sp.]|nr:RluA family pseudouridine synthase [Natronincola sp.]
MLDNPYILTTIVKEEEHGLMVKEIVYGRLDLSRGLLRRMKRGGGIYLNGKRDYLSRRVVAGDMIQIEFFDEETSMEPENIPLNIVYEDDYLLIVNKNAGMAVHPTGVYQEGTLANAIAHHWLKIGLSSKVRLVHRIDKDTSGLILVAKEPYTLQRLLQQLEKGELVREYLAVVQGKPQDSNGIITAPIGRSKDHGVKRSITSDGKKACTIYETLSGNIKASLLRLRLESGRTHQIRVHLANLGHPLWGDPLYGTPLPDLEGQALHAWRLKFIHPRTLVTLDITCPLPKNLLQIWRKVGLTGD